MSTRSSSMKDFLSSKIGLKNSLMEVSLPFLHTHVLMRLTTFLHSLYYLVLFQKLFNILYEEKIDCKLVKSNLVDDKILNWNRINAVICFNYLQQEFYLVTPTMRTLAGGRSTKAIIKLLKILLNTSQSNFGDLNLPDDCIKDIADIITAEVGAGEDQRELEGDPDAESCVESIAAAADQVGEGYKPRGAVMTSSTNKTFAAYDNDPSLLPTNLRVGAAAQQEEEEKEDDFQAQ